ncbi:MAG: hypothetical protein KF850_04645 [Labilithrix sp.]|nr:hypothetical protein [Labilithrix sp.]MBX3211300.1 hypothetical protein [Labilithrix sp.]
MGYEILVALFLTVLAPLVILGFVAFWAMTSRERALIEDTWRSYALSRGREYVPARGEWPNRTSPTVRWLDGDVRLQLSVAGVEAGARTRLVAWPRGKLLGTFTVVPKGRQSGTGGIHDAAFACAFAVTDKPSGLAARVLDARARRALLAFRQHDDVVLAYRRGKLILEWPGRESNDARLDEAARAMTELARGVDDAFRLPASADVAALLTLHHAE